MNQENIGKFIASLRKEKHLTQEQLAERLEVSVAELVEGKRMCQTNYFIKEDTYMENYKILLEVNKRKTSGEEFADKEKQEIVKVLLNGIACKEDVKKYKIRMRVNPSTDNTYPKFYIPPYNNNKKLRLVQGKMPQTHILYANHFELEVLKQLFMFAPEHPEVQKMIGSTLERLEKTCFGNYCSKGECVETGAYVLRFLEIVRPEEKEWIENFVGLSYVVEHQGVVNAEDAKGILCKAVRSNASFSGQRIPDRGTGKCTDGSAQSAVGGRGGATGGQF